MSEVRPIDANALKDEISNIKLRVKNPVMMAGLVEMKAAVLHEIENAPTIEPEVIRGRWIPTEYDSYADGEPVWDKFECSDCGHEHKGEEDTLTAFCPDCGARMEGGAAQICSR